MIIVTRSGVTDVEVDGIRERVEAAGMRTHLSRGQSRTIIGCIGDERQLEGIPLRSLPGVESVTPVLKPYKLASREFVIERSVIRVGATNGARAAFGTDEVVVVAGPCSVESSEMLHQTAHDVRARGATMLRGGAFKPRSSPYSFQGLGREALRYLSEVRLAAGIPVVTEVLDPRHVDMVAEHADMLQVGARNMQNFSLLAELGRIQRPVLLKRGLSATVEELLMAAEYVMANGNRDVVLCERGIRTFERATRNTLDVSAVPVLKRETHLPVIVDPSHAGGEASLVAPLSFAAIAAGADGLLIEVHPDPATARSDGEQSLSPDAFGSLMQRLGAFATAAGRQLRPIDTVAGKQAPEAA
ncbi:MAG: 3-deoxy-7-phosphoheptulonate synthase [Gemmatimonadaceae bacterium]